MQNLLVFLIVFILNAFSFGTKPQAITLCVNNFETEKIKNITLQTPTNGLEADTSLTYAAPTLQLTPSGKLMLVWSEKNSLGENALCYALSEDGGGTFEAKNKVAKNTGLGNSRFGKAKILFKKDGSMVAVYSQRFENPPVGKSGGRGPAGIVFSTSTNNGVSWSQPVFVDTDPSTKLLRGFFDAVIMPNDELAVVYLKDVAGSTKHEERDLRMAISKNGVMQPEVILDAIACDCCPVNISVNNQQVQVIYRDNNDDIRDMAILTSKDNGASFSASRILSTDNWKINGCPHSGAVTFHNGKNSISAWQAGSEKLPGVRFVDAAGKKLFIEPDLSAKNPALAGDANNQFMVWEQNFGTEKMSKIVYKKMSGGKISETQWLNNSDNATTASTALVGKNMVFVFEIKMANKKNQIKVERIAI
jgi:BNR repeat-like domain